MNHFVKSIAVAVAFCGAALANAADEFPDGTTIYGYRTSGSNAYFYELSQSNATELFEDPGYKSSWFVKINCGWLNDGNFAGYRADVTGTKVYELYYVELDWATGDLIKSTTLSTKNGFFKYATLNPTTATIYGYGYNADGQLAFMSAPVASPDAFTTIKTIDEAEVCYGLTWNSTESVLAGALADGTIVTIAADGTQTEVMTTDFQTSCGAFGGEYYRPQPLVWSSSEKVYYWNAESRDLESEYLWRLDPAKDSVVDVSSYVGGMYDFLLAGETKSLAGPVAPELVKFGFAEGANDGSVTLKMPALAKDGSELSGTLTWGAAVDGIEVSKGEAAPGEEIAVSFTNITNGLHTFGFSANLGDEQGAALIISRFIGTDTPAAPRNVVLTLNSLSWDAVTSGANGGYISPDIKYDIYINGEKLATTAETSYPVELPTTGPLFNVSAAVYAVAGDLRSAAGLSNSVTAGSAYIPPVELAPTAEEAMLFSTHDGYGDGSTWTFNDAEGRFQSGMNIHQEMDEWLVLPPVELQGGVSYTFSFKTTRLRSFYDEEYLEIGLSQENTASSLGAEILAKFQVPYSPAGYETITTKVEVPETGTYYFGLHAISSADMGNIFVKNFSVYKTGEERPEEELPGAVTDFTVTPSADLMSLTLSWNAPTEGYEGGEIDTDNLTYDVYIQKETAVGSLWDKLATGLTETSYVFTTEDEKLNYYSFAVIASNSAGSSPEISENGGVLGVPYELPVYDDFSSPNWYDYEPWITYMPTDDYYTRWGVLPIGSIPGLDDQTGARALCGQGLQIGCLGMAGFPVVSTKDCSEASVSVNIWTGEIAPSDISITGEVFGIAEPVTIGMINAEGEDSWQTFTFVLPDELLDQYWVKLYLNAEFPDAPNQWVVMSDYAIIPSTAGLGDINVATAATVTTSGNDLLVECADAAEVSVYNIGGAKLAVSQAAHNHVITLAKGIYIVRVGAAYFKVAIQ